MAITVGTNAYATVAQVDAWAAASLSADGWAAATDTRKETAIRQATRLFETLVRWRGEPATADQALAWPTAGLTHPTTGAVVAHDTIPPEIVDATAAFANALLVDDTSGPAEDQPARIKAGSVALAFEDRSAGEAIPRHIKDLLPTEWVESIVGHHRWRPGGP